MTSGTDWLDQARRLLDVVKSNLPEPTPDADGHGSDCRWCPLCQAAAVIRGERPEVTAALADVLTTAATALRNFSDAGARPEPETPAGDPEKGEGDPPPDVQRIEIA
jgi:hypothetical protein